MDLVAKKSLFANRCIGELRFSAIFLDFQEVGRLFGRREVRSGFGRSGKFTGTISLIYVLETCKLPLPGPARQFDLVRLAILPR